MAETKSKKDRLEQKKVKVMQKKAKLSLTSILIITVIGAMAVGGFILARGGRPDTRPVKALSEAARVAVSDPVDYTRGRVDMKKVDYKTEDGNVVISLEDIKKNTLVRFEFESPKINERQRNFAGKPVLPMMAMVDPSGNLMVAVSYCEPCRATTFHTETDLTLTCNVCGTKWDLESLAARSGACLQYPPDEVKVAVKGDKVLIPAGILEAWEPREEI